MRPRFRPDEHGAAERQAALDAEVEEELALHLDLLIRDHMANGLSRADAERAALCRFGDRSTVARLCRDVRTNERHGVSTWLRIVAVTMALGGLALAAAGPRGGPRLLGTWTCIVAVLFGARLAVPLETDTALRMR